MSSLQVAGGVLSPPGTSETARATEALARSTLIETRDRVNFLRRQGTIPRLALLSFEAGIAPAYMIALRQAADFAGIEVQQNELDPSACPNSALDALESLLHDQAISAISVVPPLPAGLSMEDLVVAMTARKDADGVHHGNLGSFHRGENRIVPCRAVAAMEVLRTHRAELAGMNIVLVASPDDAFDPLATMLLREGATVTVMGSPTPPHRLPNPGRVDAVIYQRSEPCSPLPDSLKSQKIVIDVMKSMNPSPPEGGESAMDAAGSLLISLLLRNVATAAEIAGGPEPAPKGTLDRILIRDLQSVGLVGIHEHEKRHPQALRFNIEMLAMRGGGGIGVVDYQEVCASVQKLVGTGHFELVEDLADRIAALCLADARVAKATV